MQMKLRALQEKKEKLWHDLHELGTRINYGQYAEFIQTCFELKEVSRRIGYQQCLDDIKNRVEQLDRIFNERNKHK